MKVRTQTSATGIWTVSLKRLQGSPPVSRRLISGFTLLEVMVVMVIIAILATLFVFSVGAVRSNDPAFVESERLTSLLNLARDQALLDGLDLGLRVDPEGYRFVTTLDPRLVDWIEPADNQIFRPRSLAEGLEFRLWVEEQLVELEDPDRRRNTR